MFRLTAETTTTVPRSSTVGSGPHHSPATGPAGFVLSNVAAQSMSMPTVGAYAPGSK
jgi:hypothetical protein